MTEPSKGAGGKAASPSPAPATAQPSQPVCPAPSSEPVRPPAEPLRSSLLDRAFLRDGAVTLIATFLGAGLAFWLSQLQADQKEAADVAAMVGFLRADCEEALKDVQGVKIGDGPAVLMPTTTLLTLATNPTFVGAIPEEQRTGLIGAIYAFNRAGNNYVSAATAFDSYMKIHAIEFERMRTGQQLTFLPPDARPGSPQEAQAMWRRGEDARIAELSREKQSLLTTLTNELNAVRTRQGELCSALSKASN